MSTFEKIKLRLIYALFLFLGTNNFFFVCNNGGGEVSYFVKRQDVRMLNCLVLEQTQKNKEESSKLVLHFLKQPFNADTDTYVMLTLFLQYFHYKTNIVK